MSAELHGRVKMRSRFQRLLIALAGLIVVVGGLAVVSLSHLAELNSGEASYAASDAYVFTWRYYFYGVAVGVAIFVVFSFYAPRASRRGFSLYQLIDVMISITLGIAVLYMRDPMRWASMYLRFAAAAYVEYVRRWAAQPSSRIGAMTSTD